MTGVEIPKKLAEAPASEIMTTELDMQKASQEPAALSSVEERPKKVARKETPRAPSVFAAPRLLPTFSFTKLPETDFLSAIIDPNAAALTPSMTVPPVTDIDWTRLKAMLASTMAAGKNGTQ